MEKLQRVTPIRVGKLNNREYLFFMENVLKLAKEATAEHLGVTSELLMQFESDINNIINNMNTSKVAIQTTELQSLDGQRDEVISYIFGVVRTNIKSFLSAHKEAANLLQTGFKPYVGMPILPLAQQSVQVQSFLRMCNTGEYLSAVTTLGLGEALTHLESLNDQYIELYNQRSDARTSTSCRPLRESADLIYDTISLMAQSMALVGGHASAITFVATLNKRIAETEAAYNRRKTDEGTDPADDPIVFPSTDLPGEPSSTPEDRVDNSRLDDDEIESDQRE